MDSVTMTEIHETEISNSNENENVPSTADITSKDEEGAEIKKDIQDTATATATDQSSISKDNFADDKENENPEKINIISTDKKNEEKTETDAISAVIVDDIKNVESSEEKEIGTVLSIEVTESRDVSDENEQKQNTESLVKADIVDSPVTSNNEQIEPKYDTTETSTQDIEEDVEEEEDSEDSETSSEDEMPVADTNKKTEKVEDSNISKPSDSGNVVQNEEVKEEVKNVNTNDISNQIENIISDIDINIKAQEKIAHLKEQELELIEKQKQLTNQIHQQQLLAQKLIAQNQIKENELKRSQEIQQQQQVQNENLNQYRQDSVLETYANNYNQIQDDIYKTKESSNLSRTVDLRKIFTPATDAPQILPKNRKLYASSAFYSPTLHPTVEDQVELARRISHSLSDISNQKSKGQSMFVNRKKRSVKWVHEGSFQGEDDIAIKENAEVTTSKELTQLDKLPLKLIMNPRGQMRDYNSLKDSINIETGLLSPENCAELITALQLHKGRGAELFAKRRRKADNWVVDETNAGTHSPSGIPDFQQYPAKPPLSPSILPAYSDAGKHRVQLNLHQDHLIEKYSKPGVTVVKSPWEAALQTGSASTAFLQDPTYSNKQTATSSFGSPVHFKQDVNDFSELTHSYSRPPTFSNSILSNTIAEESNKKINDTRLLNQRNLPCNPQRELAYKPSVAQGWGGRNVELPKEYFDEKTGYNNNSDDLTNYLSDRNNILVLKNLNLNHTNSQQHNSNNLYTNNTTNPVFIDSNDEVLQRLYQLELFQKRLTLEFGIELENNKIQSGSQKLVVTTDSVNKNSGQHNFSQNMSMSNIPAESKNCELANNYEENNEFANVRELICSFEKQSLRDHDAKNSKSIINGNYELTANENVSVFEMGDTSVIEGLYVPKEISLTSYAPPPVQQGSSIANYAKGCSTGIGETLKGFPISNTGLYSSQPPKQQLYGQQSYVKGPTSFSPSPIPYEKLSKFEETSNQRSLNQSFINVDKTNGYNNLRNVTPAPFGTELENRNYPPQSSVYNNKRVHNAPVTSFPSQSFNNCARGWSVGSGNQQNLVFSPKGQVSANRLPYSDF
ncbi:uncharacterized protein LOC117573098 isoform X1 [Drosophila albomicans]|uniref:Uncharacterized protein LOC117573098 isoform X1 n=1 Tax=Drosophila albomicans TaxID=7291 RepID=A0A6P8X6M6_DROAB|nr:uncharacterized protein LOC117573098 isoform X1 [Drosophila albomicans]